MKLISTGITRNVFLIGKYAIKTPAMFRGYGGWKYFLKGMVANLDENTWYKLSSKTEKTLLCPIIGCYLCGFILIMKRGEPLSEEDYKPQLFEILFKDYPLDIKIDNFGLLNGIVVLIDYAD